MFRAIIKNINLLNVLLLSAAVAFAVYILFPILDVQVKYTLPPAKKITEGAEEVTESPAIPSLAEYANISEENLFHPERKIPVEKGEQAPLPKPDFVLYGTLITDDLSLAYLEDLKAPFTTPGRGKRQAALREGDSLSGYTIKEIEAEKIVMVRGDERITVALNDPLHPKKREAVQTTVAATTSTAPATSRQPQAQVQTVTQPQRTTPARVPAVSGTKGAQSQQLQRPDIKNLKGPDRSPSRPTGRGGALLFGNQP
ncbi:MAG: hypothetical protein IBX72_11890 [Nitrospirae bacterium]|nr:hypothetical protein [Nitrospirota bacterium]